MQVELPSNVTAFTEFTALAGGDELSCELVESHLVQCGYSTLAPMESVDSKLSIVMDQDYRVDFTVSKEQLNQDDFEANDVDTARMGSAGTISLLSVLGGLLLVIGKTYFRRRSSFVRQ